MKHTQFIHIKCLISYENKVVTDKGGKVTSLSLKGSLRTWGLAVQGSYYC